MGAESSGEIKPSAADHQASDDSDADLKPLLDDIKSVDAESDQIIASFDRFPQLSDPFKRYSFIECSCPRCEDALITPPDIREFTLPYAHNVLEKYETLRKWVESYETVIQNRWAKKGSKKRRALLIRVWPHMATVHRSDYAITSHRPAEKLEGEFVEFDTDSSRMGQCSCGVLSNPQIRNYYEDGFGGQFRIIYRGAMDPLAYGRIEYKGLEQECHEGKHSFVCRNGMPMEKGILALETQQRIYDFLVTMCEAIMHDISPSALAAARPATEPSAYSCSAKQMTSLEAAAFEAPYRVPTSMDIPRMTDMLEARLQAAEDHLHSLHEDPRYFEYTILEWKEHSRRMVHSRDPTHELRDPTTERGFEAWSEVVSQVLGHAFRSVDVWDTILTKTRNLEKLGNRWSSKLCKTSDLPEEYAQGFHTLLQYLRDSMLCSARQLRNGFDASGPVRAYLLHKTICRYNSSNEKEFAKSLKRMDASHKDHKDLEDKIAQISGWKPFNCLTMDVILDALERLKKERPGVRDLMTSWVCDVIADISVMAECWRQIMLFQPWAPRLLKKIPAIEEDAANQPDTKEDNSKGARMSAKPKPPPLPELSYEVVLKAVPIGNKFYYPSDKKPSKSNIDAMRQAEANLDELWRVLIPPLAEQSWFQICHLQVLFRELARTPVWVEPEPASQIASTTEEDLAVCFGMSSIRHEVDQPRRFVPQPEKFKAKTRCSTTDHEALSGHEDISSHKTQQATEFSHATVRVDNRAARVFQLLFHVTGSNDRPGELSWTEFLYAMTNAGFTAEKLYGSVWQFTHTGVTTSLARSIQFHEPHPKKSLPYWKARRLGRRMTRRYGWSWSTFITDGELSL
ncbi:hypothetical protein JX265_007385 [Neoarthrinium moseri]|uniref:Uncharacterized protein n=1 Tax=Neoarthrinium moseri TaxID=1658444 RepID=A0A9P9WK76_9PEZI|nr:hypothetical protein JX265_007385 [Neoarthrinium moseri]